METNNKHTKKRDKKLLEERFGGAPAIDDVRAIISRGESATIRTLLDHYPDTINQPVGTISKGLANIQYKTDVQQAIKPIVDRMSEKDASRLVLTILNNTYIKPAYARDVLMTAGDSTHFKEMDETFELFLDHFPDCDLSGLDADEAAQKLSDNADSPTMATYFKPGGDYWQRLALAGTNSFVNDASFVHKKIVEETFFDRDRIIREMPGDSILIDYLQWEVEANDKKRARTLLSKTTAQII